MTVLGFSLVLTAAFCHATWNYFVKRINAGGELVWLFSVVTVCLYLPPAIYFALRWEDPTALDWVFIVGSTFLHLAYFLLLQTGYRNGDLSLIYPLARSTGPMISTTAAVLLLGETMTLQIGLGGAIIVFGVLMLTGGLRGTSRGAAASLGFGLLVGLFIGAYTVWDAYAVSVLIVPPLLIDYASAVGRTVLLAPVAWRRRDRVRRIWAEHRLGVFVIAVFSPLAYILVLFAMQFTPVVFVAPLRETSVLLSVLAGSLLLGEGHLGRRMIWAVVILCGVTLLTTGG